MLDYIYQWIENIAFYLVIFTGVMQMVPNNNYRKYIQFFSGLVLVILLMNPLLKLFGMEQKIKEIYDNSLYEQKIEEIEEATKYLEDLLDEVS